MRNARYEDEDDLPRRRGRVDVGAGALVGDEACRTAQCRVARQHPPSADAHQVALLAGERVEVGLGQLCRSRSVAEGQAPFEIGEIVETDDRRPPGV